MMALMACLEIHKNPPESERRHSFVDSRNNTLNYYPQQQKGGVKKQGERDDNDDVDAPLKSL